MFTEHERILIQESLDRILGITELDKNSTNYNNILATKTKQKKEIIDKFRGRLTGLKGLTWWLGKRDIMFFGRYYMPDKFSCTFGEHHADMFKSINSYLKGDIAYKKLMFICFREAAKSTVGNTLLGIWSLVYLSDVFLLEVSASTDITMTFIDSISTELEENDYILRDFGKLKGGRWSKEFLELSNGNAVTGKGLSGKLRGISYRNRRPSIIIMDDLEDDSTCGTDDLVKKTTKKITEKILNLGNNDTLYLFLCTLPDELSFTTDFANSNNNDFVKVKFPAIQEWSKHQELWEKYFDIKNPKPINGDINSVPNKAETIKMANKFYNENKVYLLEGTKVTWEQAKPYKTLMDKLSEIGLTAFMKEYQHDLSYSSDKVFQTFIEYDPSTLPPLNELKLLMYVDSSLGLVDIKEYENGTFDNPNAKKLGDFTAITIIGIDTKRDKVYLLYGEAEKITIDEIITKLFNLADNTYPNLDLMVIESNGAGLLRRSIEMLYKSDHKPVFSKIKLLWHNSTGDKHKRICSMKGAIESGKILFPKGLDNTYIRLVKEYKKGIKNDDPPDSLHGAISCINKLPGRVIVSGLNNEK